MKGLSFWFILLAGIFALAGMVYGIVMSSTADHTLAPAHAHNNLIGWVTLALYGLYYARVPSAGLGILALGHFWVSVIGALLIGPGIAMAILGEGEAVAVIASLLTLIGMVMFVVNVVLHRSALVAD